MKDKNLKYYNIFIDGIDKAGKDLIAQYVIKLSNYKYIVNGRGIISQLAYGELHNRNYKYCIEQQKNIINVFLDVNEEDWMIRCEINKEPMIDYINHRSKFLDAYYKFKEYKYPVIYFNTSDMTPYQIAEEIIKYADKLNNKRKVIF